MESEQYHQPLHHEDDSPEAFAERVRALYGLEKTGMEELVELANSDPNGEHFETLLDDLTYEALAENEEFTDNGKKMQSGKLSQDEQLELRDKQRALFNQYRQAIIQEAGLPTEAALTEFEKSKQKVKAIVGESLDSYEVSHPLRVLEALGIISHDKDGKEIFVYPRGLFPKSTDSKWDTYLESVRKHLRIERSVSHGTVDKSELGHADSIRRMAHNSVSRDIHEILSLDQLPDSSWDFDKTRNLLAKMRDSRFPTVETGEKFLTEKAILGGVIGLHAVKALRTRLSDLHK